LEDGREACLVILSGTVTVEADGQTFERLGARESVFDGPATSVYVPADTPYRIGADSASEVAICTAPGDGDYDFRPFIEALAAARYSGWIVIEAEQDPAIADPRCYSQLGLDTLKRLAREMELG
jgi:hypothetical protein